MNNRLPLMALLGSAALLAACKPATPAAASADTAASAPAAAPAAVEIASETRIGALVIAAATSRETPVAGGTAPGFMTVRNNGDSDDRLVSASSSAIDSVELHEMSMADGKMQMRALPDGLVIPAGTTILLAPGGLHLMLIGVHEALVAGKTLPVELRFEKAGTVTVPLTVMARKMP